MGELGRNLRHRSRPVPDADFVNEPVKKLRIHPRADPVVERGHVDPARGSGIAELSAIPIPPRLRPVERDGQMVPAVAVWPGGVRQNAVAKVFVVIVAPEEMADAARSAQTEAISPVGGFFAPESDLAAELVAGWDGRGVDPGLNREALAPARYTRPRKSDVRH